MKSSLSGWIAFLVLAALIGVSSCQALMGSEGDPAGTTAGDSQ